MTPTRFAPSPHPAGAAARSSVEAGSWTAVGHHRQRQPIAQAGISASGNGIRAWRAPNGSRRATGSPTGPPRASPAPTGWSMAPEQGRGEAGSDDQWARRRAYLRHRRSGSGVFCRPLTRCRRCGRTCGTGRPIRAGCAASCGDAPAASRCRRRALALSTAGSTSWPARLAALLPEATGPHPNFCQRCTDNRISQAVGQRLSLQRWTDSGWPPRVVDQSGHNRMSVIHAHRSRGPQS